MDSRLHATGSALLGNTSPVSQQEAKAMAMGPDAAGISCPAHSYGTSAQVLRMSTELLED